MVSRLRTVPAEARFGRAMQHGYLLSLWQPITPVPTDVGVCWSVLMPVNVDNKLNGPESSVGNFKYGWLAYGKYGLELFTIVHNDVALLQLGRYWSSE